MVPPATGPYVGLKVDTGGLAVDAIAVDDGCGDVVTEDDGCWDAITVDDACGDVVTVDDGCGDAITVDDGCGDVVTVDDACGDVVTVDDACGDVVTLDDSVYAIEPLLILFDGGVIAAILLVSDTTSVGEPVKSIVPSLDILDTADFFCPRVLAMTIPSV